MSKVKSFFRGIGEALEAYAEAEAARTERRTEIVQQMRELDEQLVANGGVSVFDDDHRVIDDMWSKTSPGHLKTCPSTCSRRHCPTCGDYTSGSYSVFCYKHR